MNQKTIALVRGDGAAPEAMAVACEVAVEAAAKDGMKLVFDETPMGWNAFAKHGTTLPESSLARVLELGTVFFGGVGNPNIDKTLGRERPELLPERLCLLATRKMMGLLVNTRPVIYLSGLEHLAKARIDCLPAGGITQIWLRFLLQGGYFGNDDLGHLIPPDLRSVLGLMPKSDITGNEERVIDLAYYSREALETYFRFAFAEARARALPMICVDKSNITNRSDFWRKVFKRIALEFPDVQVDYMLVDAACAALFTPAAFNAVIVGGNTYLDILSDGAVEAMGSMGLMCSSAVNPSTGAAMFESGAGTAYRLAGMDKINPLGRILTAAMMLRHIGAPKGAEAIETAVRRVLAEGYRMPDIFSQQNDDPKKVLGTVGMGEHVLSRL
jgi:3-isopropylmalate dehydrogenase